MKNQFYSVDFRARSAAVASVFIVIGIILLWIVIGIFFLIIGIEFAYDHYIANRCELAFSKHNISGTRKKLFGQEIRLQMPHEKLDNVMVLDTLNDKWRGGKTIAV